MTTHQATSPSPGRDAPADSAVERFVTLQSRLLDHYGVRATSRFVDLARPAMRAHYLEAGEGEPLIFLHGGDGEAVNWAPLMAVLQHHAHIYAVDRPGFGLSDAFDYRQVDLRAHAAEFVDSLLAALGLSAATVVGGSMGGFFALSAALDRPARIRRLVLAGYAAGTTREIGGLARLCGTPGAPEAFMASRASMEAQRSQYRDMFHIDPDTVPDLYFETRIAGLRLPSEQGTWATILPRLGTLEGLRPEVYLGDEVSRIGVPVLVISGDHDMAPAEAARDLADRLPRGRFAFLPGIGHFPFLEAPEETGSLITAFLRDS